MKRTKINTLNLKKKKKKKKNWFLAPIKVNCLLYFCCLWFTHHCRGYLKRRLVYEASKPCSREAPRRKILSFLFIRYLFWASFLLNPIFLRKINFGFAASLVDDRRHEAKINFGCAASQLQGLVDKSSF